MCQERNSTDAECSTQAKSCSRSFHGISTERAKHQQQSMHPLKPRPGLPCMRQEQLPNRTQRTDACGRSKNLTTSHTTHINLTASPFKEMSNRRLNPPDLARESPHARRNSPSSGTCRMCRGPRNPRIRQSHYMHNVGQGQAVFQPCAAGLASPMSWQQPLCPQGSPKRTPSTASRGSSTLR